MKILKQLLPVLALILCKQAGAARLDSFRISRTSIHLAIRNFSAKTIAGYVTHKIYWKVQTDRLTLDLSGMTVDSVKIDAVKLGHARSKDKLHITLDRVYSATDSVLMDIFYHGTPAADPTGWGGFYFSGDYAFNLGVGFGVNPHSFGRAWFPCVDEFQMKSAYDLYIETDTNYTAACNGVLIDILPSANARIWHYSENKVMSAYLASVSVSKFSILKSDYQGMEGVFPVWLLCKPADTAKVKSSFVNLPKAIHAFESAFGPQVYSKVGYNFVPFNAGAMEHAGNITYPGSFADGTLDNESLFAHELSHHWWGDNVTCMDEGDMWLNEGWASYCEHFFKESVYGREAYKRSILSNHLYVLRFAHINDGQAFPMVNIPHAKTYGDHVYKKGADVIHSLRSVVGDSVFFGACKAYQSLYRYGNASTDKLQAVFEQNGGGQKATDFFTYWIKEKGFPHVIISRQEHSGNGPHHLKIWTLQRPRFTQQLYVNMPMEVFFFKDKNTYEKRTVVINHATDSFEFSFGFKPVYVCLDYDEKLSDAITDRSVITQQNGTYDFQETFSRVTVKTISDSSLIRVEHHWIGPELYRTQAPYMSNYRYYTLDGVWNDDLKMDIELSYDGRPTNLGYLDHTLIYKTEDSLTVLYRAFPGDYWRIWPDLQFNYGNSKNDKSGSVTVKDARRGDYVFAMYDKSLSIGAQLQNTTRALFKLSPNPASEQVLLTFADAITEAGTIELIDDTGKVLFSRQRIAGEKSMTISTCDYPAGVYTVNYRYAGSGFSDRLLINR